MDLNNPTERMTIVREFAAVINRNSLENGSNTPDLILADMLVRHLEAFNDATQARKEYFAEASLPKNQSQANGRKPFFRT